MTARNKEVLKRKKYLVDEKWRKRREDYERFKPHKKQRHRVKMHPEIEIVKWIESAQKIKTSLSMGPELFYDRIREYLSILVKKPNLRKRIEDLKGKIMSLISFTKGLSTSLAFAFKIYSGLHLIQAMNRSGTTMMGITLS